MGPQEFMSMFTRILDRLEAIEQGMKECKEQLAGIEAHCLGTIDTLDGYHQEPTTPVALDVPPKRGRRPKQ